MSRFTRRFTPRHLAALAAVGLGLVSAGAQAAPLCPPGFLAQAKDNHLYLYFATSSDSTFPSYAASELSSGATSPLAAFSVSDLDGSIGTTSALRNRIFDLVIDDYCEFNVQVNATTSMPSPSAARWQIVGFGSDSAVTNAGNKLFGIAQDVDVDDSEPQDYARVFAKSFKDAFGGAGGALNGSGSTLERWATAIGETAAHEAAHNYGAEHKHSAPRPNSAEDAQNWHLMATGSTGLTGEMRAGRDRHFSDTEYEILGHNVGLNTYTLHNWDFVNPNDTNADKMRMKLLSTVQSLDLNGWYTGFSSPWGQPAVTYTGTTQSFQGTTYFVHDLDFSVAKPWIGPTPGVVEPAANFHTGATFSGDEAVIIFDVQLFSGATLLPLAPRLPGYDAGNFDLDSGDFTLNFFNPNPGAGELVLTEVLLFRSPRMIDIGSMLRGVQPVDLRGASVEFLSSDRFGRQELRDRVTLPLGRLTDKRSVDIVYGPEDCPRGSVGSGDAETGEVEYCIEGNALSLFPATYTYLVATVEEPNARHWDPLRREMVTGPLQTVVYYQLGGTVPDFNHNDVDDLIDIRTGTSRDDDRNGVPDEAQRRR